MRPPAETGIIGRPRRVARTRPNAPPVDRIDLPRGFAAPRSTSVARPRASGSSRQGRVWRYLRREIGQRVRGPVRVAKWIEARVERRGEFLHCGLTGGQYGEDSPSGRIGEGRVHGVELIFCERSRSWSAHDQLSDAGACEFKAVSRWASAMMRSAEVPTTSWPRRESTRSRTLVAASRRGRGRRTRGSAE